MHPEAAHFLKFVRDALPMYFVRVRVLDVGAGDINGNSRTLFEDAEYHGNDVMAAPNVTIVSATKDLPFPDAFFDTIVSSECFEHDPTYRESLQKMVKMLRPGGLLLFTCASTGRAEHGTRRTTPQDCYATMAGLEEFQDYYKNLDEQDIREALGGDLSAIFSSHRCYYNPRSHDLYFYGIKHVPEYYPM
jgi:SAM-dependent methyltransferase